MHFFEPSVITDQPKFQLSLTLHALLSLASSPSFSCLYRGRFLRQLTSIDECIFSFPRVEGVSSRQTQSPSRFGARVCSFLAHFSSLWNVTSTNRQNRTPHKPPAHPCCCPQCRPHHTLRTVKRLYLTLQCPMACPGLATLTLAGLSARCG